MFQLPDDFIGSFTQAIYIPFAPYSFEICITLECILLAETCYTILGTKHGPIKNLLLFAPWNENFPNSQLYPHEKTLIDYAHFWQVLINFMNNKTQFKPLPQHLLITLKRDLILLLEKSINQSLHCCFTAQIYNSWNGTQMINSTTIAITRPPLDTPTISRPLGDSWIRLREQFDEKRSKNPPWSNEQYLVKHQAHYEKYLESQTENESDEN